jgi:hypothetical protein
MRENVGGEANCILWMHNVAILPNLVKSSFALGCAGHTGACQVPMMRIL